MASKKYILEFKLYDGTTRRVPFEIPLPEKGVDYFDGLPGKTPEKGVDYWTPEELLQMISDVLASEEINKIQQDIQNIRDDMNYREISITSISNNIGTVEKGVAVSEMEVTWVLNKNPVSQTLGGETLDVNLRKKTVSMEGRTSVSLSVTDERGKTATKSTGYNAYNGVYYGVLDDGVTIDSVAILSLNKKIQNSKTVNFAADCTGGKRIAYAIPASGYGNPVFQDVDTKFPLDMTQVPGTIQFTNVHGYTTEYKVWLSTNVVNRLFNVAVT